MQEQGVRTSVYIHLKVELNKTGFSGHKLVDVCASPSLWAVDC